MISTNMKQLNIDGNKKRAPDHHISFISEGSCDTEDLDAENSALDHRSKSLF